MYLIIVQICSSIRLLDLCTKSCPLILRILEQVGYTMCSPYLRIYSFIE